MLRQETVGGAIALLAAVVAVVWANVDYASYQDLRHLQLGPLDVEHWAADGALSLFFFVAGLELKRELLVGSLRRPADAVVPVVAAVCGVAVPALVYVSVDLASGGDDLAGWAIPSATDIAFALAVLAVVGSALPTPLRAFLLTLAVVDDLLVIVIIAVFYTDELSFAWLGGALVLLAAYAVLQRRRVASTLVYVPLGGSHLVVRARERRPRHRGRHRARAAHAGDPRPRRGPLPRRTSRAPAGAAELGRRRAVLRAAERGGGVQRRRTGNARRAGRPARAGGRQAPRRAGRSVAGHPVHPRGDRPRLRLARPVGVALLAGVGFTVSLLVSDLSFDDARREEAKTAVLVGSLVSALLAALVLGRRNRRPGAPPASVGVRVSDAAQRVQVLRAPNREARIDARRERTATSAPWLSGRAL